MRCSCSSANLGSCSSFFFTALPLSTSFFCCTATCDDSCSFFLVTWLSWECFSEQLISSISDNQPASALTVEFLSGWCSGGPRYHQAPPPSLQLARLGLLLSWWFHQRQRSSLTPGSHVDLGWASCGCRAEHYLLRQLQSKVAYTQEDTSNQRPQNVSEIQRYATTTGLWRKPGGPELSFEVDDQPPVLKTKHDELLSYKVEEKVCKLASFFIEHVPRNESKHLGNPASGSKQAAELIFSWVTSYPVVCSHLPLIRYSRPVCRRKQKQYCWEKLAYCALRLETCPRCFHLPDLWELGNAPAPRKPN